jgi:excisionase family DNA binding protein
MERLAYSVREAAAALGVSSRTIVREIQRGHLRAARVGKRVLVPQSELERLISEGCTTPQTQARERHSAA